ncbi:SRPBCC family protein [Nocardioides marmoriginsengisoli]|uniref:SRPBCC family protein n=1 Tax=Nocardioides marmoriginsengisoli TaxID=661483 RepID=A0A3N0CBA8_9ACTN|nr:SRPBCC family protein [Nocardioides marmoriginsengisoli]RNL60734.1 SRPBCC family protein [Nocardioides marmoriginsengisoli]
MPLTDVAPISASIEIAAPPAQVWAQVSDLRNMSQWSPQTAKSILRGENGLGARFININRKGPLVWPTQTKIVRFDEPGADSTGEIAWRVKENYTIWSLRLEPTTDGGTKLTSTREAPEGISDVSVRLTKVAFGGVPKFTSQLETDMGKTLAKIKAAVEA